MIVGRVRDTERGCTRGGEGEWVEEGRRGLLAVVRGTSGGGVNLFVVFNVQTFKTLRN